MPLPHESDRTSPEEAPEGAYRSGVRNLGRLTVVGLLVVAAAACGSDGDSSSSTSSTTKAAASSLDRTDWVAEDSSAFATEGVSVTLEFADGRVSGTGGCNNYGGSLQVEGSNLTIGSDLMSTKIACPPPATAWSQRYLAVLPKVATFEANGDTLTLHDATGRRCSCSCRPTPRPRCSDPGS